jgi:hypothetical protein
MDDAPLLIIELISAIFLALTQLLTNLTIYLSNPNGRSEYQDICG